jgi:hypothetical protein
MVLSIVLSGKKRRLSQAPSSRNRKCIHFFAIPRPGGIRCPGREPRQTYGSREPCCPSHLAGRYWEFRAAAVLDAQYCQDPLESSRRRAPRRRAAWRGRIQGSSSNSRHHSLKTLIQGQKPLPHRSRLRTQPPLPGSGAESYGHDSEASVFVCNGCRLPIVRE